ncbi:ABC transporter permease [Leifsonia sp. McL0607]|uniref:ABC transporter permease n=1 Tax=Leifsonia sp. McL0607 TaxID=3415672 RepID=UPI003CF47583
MSSPEQSTESAPHAPHTPWLQSAVLGVLLSAVVCVVVLAFSWPSATLNPQNLPVAITGPAQAVDQVKSTLDEQADGAFDLIVVPDRASAVDKIQSRDAYGAIVLGTTPEVLTASAAGAATNQLMTQLHTQLQTMAQAQAAAAAKAAGAPTVPTVTIPLTDIVPLVSTDSRGVGLTIAALPLVLGGMIGGIAITFAVSGAWRRVLALFSYSIAGGLAIAGILQGWFGFLGGSYWANAGAFGLTLLAMGATIVGFASLIGRIGVAVGPVLFMLIGNPISGAQFPKEFLPVPWGAIGQYLPPGAGISLLRNTSYFHDANSAFPILVLCAWAVLGLVLIVVGHFRDQGRLAVEENPADVRAKAVPA